MRLLYRLAAWCIASVVLGIWSTCRCRVVGHDPRPALRAARRGYSVALLHAHQALALMANDEERLCAMVSRSRDGDLLVPSLRVRGAWAVRGSSRKGNVEKGGRRALEEMKTLVGQGGRAVIAVDGPRGPRNRVHRGVIELAQATGTPIIPIALTSSRRWILTRTWDRFQIPKPFSRIALHLATPIEPAGHDMESLRALVSRSILELECRVDPEEAARAGAAALLADASG